MSELVDQLIKRYLGLKIDKQDVMNNYGSTVADLNAEYVAKTMGVRVLKGNVIGNTTTSEQKPQLIEDRSKNDRRLRDSLFPLIAGALIGGPVGAVATAYLGRSDPQPVAAPTIPDRTTSVEGIVPSEVEVDIR